MKEAVSFKVSSLGRCTSASCRLSPATAGTRKRTSRVRSRASMHAVTNDAGGGLLSASHPCQNTQQNTEQHRETHRFLMRFQAFTSRGYRVIGLCQSCTMPVVHKCNPGASTIDQFPLTHLQSFQTLYTHCQTLLRKHLSGCGAC